MLAAVALVSVSGVASASQQLAQKNA